MPLVVVAQSVSDVSPPAGLVATAVVVLAAGAVHWVAGRLGVRFVETLGRRDAETGARAQTLWVVLRRVLAVTVWLTAALVVLVVWNVSITPFLAVGTVFGAAIGFGAQDLIKDLIAGFFILLEDQFHVGDVVTVAGTTGVVHDIQFRVTVLRDLEGNVHYVPNGQITVTTNYTDQFAQPIIDIGVAYGADVDRALQVMGEELESMAADPEWADRIQGGAEVMGVERLDDSAVLLRARLTTVATERWAVRREALRRLKRRFEAEGIAIPFPQLTIHQGD